MYSQVFKTTCGHMNFKNMSEKRRQKNVVITGSSNGLGKSLAKQFINQGDNVIITSRNKENVFNACLDISLSNYEKKDNIGRVIPFVADVSNHMDCKKLVEFSNDVFDSIDIWINNAGTNAFKISEFHHFDEVECESIVNTNLLGTMYCCKYIIPIFEKQKTGILINLEGAGSNGLATPNYSIYGATKSAITQFTKSLTNEYSKEHFHICTISPGMVLTDLLLKNTDVKTKQFLNIFSEESDYIANFLIKRINKINSSCHIHYLTIQRIMWLLILFQFRKNRHFDHEGNLHKK
jgi:chlorophyll(ide) b reductase